MRSVADRSASELAVLRAFRPLGQALRRFYEREFSPLGLAVAHVHPLLVLLAHGPMRQRELAERLEVEGPTVVRLLDQLEALRLVARDRDADDHRANSVHLTDAGQVLAERARPLMAELAASLLAEVSDDELATCLGVFDCLAARTGAAERDPVVSQQ